jgi:hypothetical protein
LRQIEAGLERSSEEWLQLADRGIVIGSPEYFASHRKPRTPHDLTNHRCINLRGGSAGPYR